jgi:fructose-6-phosphate aldolase 2
MRILLDTANLEDIKYFNEYYPIEGVTTNPTILSQEGGDVLALLKEIRNIIGWEKELHVQVTETEYDKIIEEAKALVAFLGKNTYVKIPATDVGLKATRMLSERGYKITVTAILSEAQAMLASNAGAAYVAPYVSRLDNLCADGVGTVSQVADIFAISGAKTQILAASFKTAKEVLDVAVAGCHCATVGSSVMKNLLAHSTTDTSIARFKSDWTKAFGDVTLLGLLKEEK